MSTTANQLGEQPQLSVYTMTFDDYDKFMQEATESKRYGVVPNWPSLADIEEMKAQLPVKDLALMFSWLSEMNPEPSTDDEKASCAAMRRYSYEHLRLIEGIPEAATQCVMTFNDYDEFIQRATEIELYGLRPYWPTESDINDKGSQFSVQKLTLVLAWLLEMNPEPRTDAEKSSYNAMKRYVCGHLKLVGGSSKKQPRAKATKGGVANSAGSAKRDKK